MVSWWTWKQFKKRANISLPFLSRNFRIFSFSLNCWIQFCSETDHTLVDVNFTPPFTKFQSFWEWHEKSSSGSFILSGEIANFAQKLIIHLLSSFFFFSGENFILRFLETLMRGLSRKHDAWALSSSVVSLQFLSDGMADPSSYGNLERDIEQVSFPIRLIFSLKKICFLVAGKILQFWDIYIFIRHDHTMENIFVAIEFHCSRLHFYNRNLLLIWYILKILFA